MTVATVLVLEDDDPTRKMICGMVESLGHDVWEAPNGDQGMMLCRLLLPDLVITDIIMPVKDGLETIVDLQETFECSKVIAMSAHRDKLEQALRLGARHVLRKPFDPQELVEAVKDALQY